MLSCPCPACGADVEVPRHYLSRKVRCPDCNEDFIAKLREKGDPALPQATVPLIPASAPAVPVAPAPAAPPTRTEPAPPVDAKPKVRWSLVALVGLCAFGIVTTTAAWVWESHQRTLVEKRVALQEEQITSLFKQVRALSGDRSQFDDLSKDLSNLDEVLASVASENKQQKSTVLRTEYTIQQSHRVLLRQQADLGRVATRLVMLEREVADKSRQAKEAMELASKHRKEADEASKPIRARIKDLETQKEKLFSRYQALSTPRRPENVVSTRRAREMMADWERRVAPMLQQLEQEIEQLRRSIEEEEEKIERLYALPEVFDSGS
jgi:DNA-directed RNA polymerase subunit RPC12/RpoP